MTKQTSGRPQAFNPDDAIDCAVELFWQHGYEGVDVDSTAQAVGVTKPSLYRAFGGKSALLSKAVERYVETYGGAVISAFESEDDLLAAVTRFCEAIAETATSAIHPGCLLASATFGQSEDVSKIREFAVRRLSMTARILERRFEQEIQAGRLSSRILPSARSKMLVDAMHGIAFRARAGAPAEELLADARTYAHIIIC